MAGSVSYRTSLRILSRIQGMTRFADFAAVGRRLERARGRLEKRDEVARFLRTLAPDEIVRAVAFLAARAFPASDPRVLGVRGLPSERPGEAEALLGPLTPLHVAEAFADVAAAAGSGVRRARDERLARLASRASDDERDFLARIVGGEMRTGVSEGLLLEAIAAAWGVDVATTRRAALFLGDLTAVAVLAATGGAAAVAGASPRPFVPLLPMLAEIADDFPSVLAAHGGRTALEYKYDGARIQLHRAGDRVQVWTRRLSDVTRSLPDVVEITRRDLSGEPFILDAALAAGHEGVMAKDLASTYEPGGRGKRWFKLKAAETVDCVIVAVDRGSGRRRGWLSNYHLAVRDGETFAEVGKTFKGLTDAQFVEMTERLWKLATADDGYTVRVRPEVVVEVEYNEIQKSPTYPSGHALRFARIARVRDDKAPGQATTLDELRHLYERQFQTKGRAADVV